MRNPLLLFSFLFFLSGKANGQLFAIQHDTIYYHAGTDFTAINNINNLTGVKDTIQWQLVVNTWPADWIATLGICDMCSCKTPAQIWPTALQECGYNPGWGDFHITGDLSTATTSGTYMLRVRLNRKNNLNDTAWQTYITTRVPASVANVNDVSTDVTLYPNPATNTLNVTYDATAEIKSVAIYSIIGKQMNAFGVTNNKSASLNIENLPPGIYFVRLLNGHSDVFATRKFTKQ